MGGRGEGGGGRDKNKKNYDGKEKAYIYYFFKIVE
jgi:hypothetical protein